MIDGCCRFALPRVVGLRFAVALLTLGTVVSGCSAAPRLIDEDADGAFAVYRSGRLDVGQLAALCDLGVEEVAVMDGGAVERECRYRERVCPGLRVRYNHAQDARQPVSLEFLEAFDAWVEESRASGRKIAFRCRHGWHRAGRLSAYYRMRFQSWGVSEAIAEMLAVGRFMDRHPELQPQVEAMADRMDSRSCSQEPQFCPQAGSPSEEGLVVVGDSVRFAADVCGSTSR